MEHVDQFRSHLDVLFLHGHILKMGDSYTGVTLAYVKEAHFYYGSNAAVFGIEDPADPGTPCQAREARQQIQHIVANIEEFFKVNIDMYLRQGRGTGG